jgi:hypothetical protein
VILLCWNVFQFDLSGDRASAIYPEKGLAEFEKVKIAETIESRGDKSCRPLHSPLWQVDSDKIRRMAPIEFIRRYMPGWFDCTICDEIHQLVSHVSGNGTVFGFWVRRLLRFGVFTGNAFPVAEGSAAKKTTLGYPIGLLPTF